MSGGGGGGGALNHLPFLFCKSVYKENLMIKLSHIISEMRKITLQIRIFMIFMFHPMLWKNPTFDPNSVSNIFSCSTLPEFLSEMTLIILTLNMVFFFLYELIQLNFCLSTLAKSGREMTHCILSLPLRDITDKHICMISSKKDKKVL